uniref:RHS repeat domain-containing protein n=1 Tax=Lachnobacterium bovis TaxID=140626 RepID=UPI00048691A4
TYLYGALNRLEQATDAKGLIARYSYDGLGHRVSRQVGTINHKLGQQSKAQSSQLGDFTPITRAKVSNMSQVDVAKNLAVGLDPMQQLNTKTQITNPMSRIDYVIDLTKEYRNMLSSTSYDYDLSASEDITANTIGSVPANTPINSSTQTFTWADEELVESSTDIAMNMSEKSGADIAAFSDSGYNFQPQNRYTFLNDDLGSTMRMSNGAGVLQATYAYDEFGQEILDGINTLKNALGKVADLVNPFGFVGYQLDNVADDYFAEAREYRPEEGRFSGTDVIQGTIEMPFTLNRYGYCYNNGMLMNDLNGMWPNPIKWVKNKTKKAAKAVGSAVNKAGKAWGKFYAKYRDAVNIVGGVAVIAAGVALAPVVGVSAGVVAISGTTAAVIGGLSNMTTGGRFSDGFLGGAVNGTICGLTGGTKVVGVVKKVGQFFGGAIGTAVTETLGGERKPLEIFCDAMAAGVAQFVYSMTMGNALDFGRRKTGFIGNRCVDFFDYPSQYSVGTSVSAASNGLIKFDDKEKNKECNTQVEKR